MVYAATPATASDAPSRTAVHGIEAGRHCALRVACKALLLLLVAAPAHASDKLELTPDLIVTGILLVSFIVIVQPLNALIFQPLFRVMDARAERIEGARARAEQIQAQAEQALGRYEEAILGAREEAVTHRREQLEAARAELLQTTRAAKHEAETELERAREGLQGSITAARQELRTRASDLAVEAAESVLGRRLS